MGNDLLYQISLTDVPNIGAVQAKILVDYFGDAASIFNARKKELEILEGIGEIRANSIKLYKNFSFAENEIDFIEKYKIETLFLTMTLLLFYIIVVMPTLITARS
jgi:DNA processing protein